MNRKIVSSLIAATLVLGLPGLAQAQAQAGGATRAQVKMDRDAFLAMAQWDPVSSTWVLKPDMAMPEGVLSRAEVKAMRDKFLSMHTWENTTGQWVPIKGAPRDMGKLSREQVKKETLQHLKTHRFDEATQVWVAR